MRIALYHNLPPGGALRVLWEFVRVTNGANEYDLFSIDMGPADTFSYASDRGEPRAFDPVVAAHFCYPLYRRGLHLPLGRAQVLDAVRRIRRVERDIANAINAGGYDAVLVHPCRLSQAPSLLQDLRVPSLYYMHEPRRRSFEKDYRTATATRGLGSVPRWAATTVMERTLRARDLAGVQGADRIACNSHYTAEAARMAYGVDADVCYPGIDDITFDVPSREAREDLRVISVGALDRIKGHDLVVRALATLPPSQRPILDVVYERCEPSYQTELVNLARSEKVKLRLHRGLTDADLATLYGRASATVLTARLEPLGLVALESLACGTPVVALSEGGYRETITEGVNGFLVGRDPREIANGIGRVLRGDLGASPEALRRTVIPRWNWTSAAKRQLELLAAVGDLKRR